MFNVPNPWGQFFLSITIYHIVVNMRIYELDESDTD